MARSGWIVLLLAVGLVCYYLPWYTHDTAGFTMHAFDLAEWTSIHPAVRAESPAMLTSFLLRFPQLALIVALALSANQLADRRAQWALRGAALLLTLRFVPPGDFWGAASDDPNYRQMALYAALGLALALGTIPLARFPQRWQDVILSGGVLAGMLAGWNGLSRARTLLDNFEIEVAFGAGIWGLTLITAGIIGLALWPHLKFAR